MIDSGSVCGKLKDEYDLVEVGDTISYVPGNQEGYERYEVFLDKNGKKNIRLIDSYDKQMSKINGWDDEEDEYTDEDGYCNLDESLKRTRDDD